MLRKIVEAAILPGVFEIPHIPGNDYVAFTDPSGGSSDSFTLAIATSRPSPDDEDAMIGELTACVSSSRHSPRQLVSEICKTLHSYDLDTVTGDRYGGGFPPERFKEHGVTYEVSELPKSQIYADSLPLLNAGRIPLR